MRLTYFYYKSPNQGSGVEKKVFTQVQCLHKLGVNARLLLINDTGLPSQNVSYITEKMVYINGIFQKVKLITIVWRESLKVNLLKECLCSRIEGDIIYMRSPYPSPQLWLFLKKHLGAKVVTEHQTLEWEEYKLQNKYSYLIADLVLGNAIRKHTDAIVGVTDEITQYQLSRAGDPNKPHITIGNGFDVASALIRTPPSYTNNDLHLLCVANVSRWHGLDRLLRGLATHNGTPRVILHIAGDGAELPSLQQMTEELGISDRVIFHGFTSGEALDALFDQCHLAVGSLGIHRIGLEEASILKAREYCARGIPFIYGISDPDFPPDFPYILQLPSDESPIDIKQVIAFADKVFADPDHPQKMRAYAEEHLDWSVKMKKLKTFLESLVDEPLS